MESTENQASTAWFWCECSRIVGSAGFEMAFRVSNTSHRVCLPTEVLAFRLDVSQFTRRGPEPCLFHLCSHPLRLRLGVLLCQVYLSPLPDARPPPAQSDLCSVWLPAATFRLPRGHDKQGSTAHLSLTWGLQLSGPGAQNCMRTQQGSLWLRVFCSFQNSFSDHLAVDRLGGLLVVFGYFCYFWCPSQVRWINTAEFFSFF